MFGWQEQPTSKRNEASTIESIRTRASRACRTLNPRPRCVRQGVQDYIIELQGYMLIENTRFQRKVNILCSSSRVQTRMVCLSCIHNTVSSDIKGLKWKMFQTLQSMYQSVKAVVKVRCTITDWHKLYDWRKTRLCIKSFTILYFLSERWSNLTWSTWYWYSGRPVDILILMFADNIAYCPVDLWC